MYRDTYVLINLDNIEHNVTEIIKYYNDYEYYFGVVKGNAYSHSDMIVDNLIESGINYLCTSSLEEALNIRKINQDIKILVLGPVRSEYLELCAENNITVTVHDYEYFMKIKDVSYKNILNIHIKVDSGMNRLGIKDKDELKKIVDLIRSNNMMYLEGIFTHFQTTGFNDTLFDKQVSNFNSITALIDIKSIPIVHLGRSQTMLNHEKFSYANGIRLGIIMYGFDLTPRITSKLGKIKYDLRKKIYKISDTRVNNDLKLKTAFSLYSEVIQVKKVNKDEYIGYGTQNKALEDMIIAIAPIGYGDGFIRKNYNRDVLINKKRYKIIADVCMDMIIIKVDETVSVNDKITLIGEEISIREVSRHLETTVYETLQLINQRVPRVLAKDDVIVKIDSKFSGGQNE